MAVRVPVRIAWALEVLDIGVEDHLLELGCGRGLAMALACERLERGSILGIDRSETAIHAARERLSVCIEAGKASLQVANVAEADLAPSAYDRVFAINVNLFWLKAARELAVLRSALAPGGRVFLFYDPPSGAQIESIAEKVRLNLEQGSFKVEELLTESRDGANLLCVIAS